jgi:hypothetical protein
MSKYSNLNEDNINYWHYTGPQRIDKAMHVLEGILIGMASDGVIINKEINLLRQWLKEYEDISQKNPFKEACELLYKALADGVLDEDEKKDLLWFCNRFTTTNNYFDQITSDLQKLHGILGGILSDGIISKEELGSLNKWLEENEHLKGNWPFDELEVLIMEVLKDGVINADEHKFLDTKIHKSISYPLNEVEKPIMGICAVCPDVKIAGKTFCFTGKFKNIPRKNLELIVSEYGGIFSEKLTKNVDYLIIGADGNQSWAYSCYGRKVEQAIQYRKEGNQIIIAHEYDFLDAIKDLK